MLATPETLLNMSLQKGKFAQAEQVKKVRSVASRLINQDLLRFMHFIEMGTHQAAGHLDGHWR